MCILFLGKVDTTTIISILSTAAALPFFFFLFFSREKYTFFGPKVL